MMQANGDLKKLERRAFLTFFQDGLWDIFFGAFVVSWGIMIMTDVVVFIGAWCVAGWFVMLGLKKWVTYPRIGYVKLGNNVNRMRLKLSIVFGTTASLGMLLLVTFGLSSRPDWLVDYFPLIFTGILGLVVAGIGLWRGITRFPVYGILLIAAGAVHQWTDIEWGHTLVTAGGIIVLCGIGILIKFIRDNPVSHDEGTDSLD